MGKSLVQLLLGTTADPTKLGIDDVHRFIGTAQTLLLAIAAGWAAVGLIMAGYQYMTSFGDDAKATKAKNTMKWVVIGVIIIIISKVLIYEVQIHVGDVVSQPVSSSMPSPGGL